MVQIQTKYFGEIEYDSEDVLHFRDGLFGFETEHHFLLLPFSGSEATLLCLQSVKTPSLAFVVMNPFSLNPNYAPILQENELQAMGVTRSQDLCFYVLCVVRNPVSNSTVNLKCPVIINDDTQEAAQVILDMPEYDMRHPLSEFRSMEADGTC
ncbi:MAG: fliW [Paenibacillus sp.]|jgi:flagellar assembly factor FliW|nr:fliW [Paenibacillus sp.]